MDSGLILLVDDDSHDVEYVHRSCKQLGVLNTIQHVNDGEQAMDYLAGRGVFSQRNTYPFPTLVLLDIRMPKCSGFEVLKLIHRDKNLCHIPVVLHTAYDTPENRKQGLQLGAEAFLPKTTSVEFFGHLLVNLNARVLVPFHPESVIQFDRRQRRASPGSAHRDAFGRA